MNRPLAGSTASAIRRRLVSEDPEAQSEGLSRARGLSDEAMEVLLRPWPMTGSFRMDLPRWFETTRDDLPLTPVVLGLLLEFHRPRAVCLEDVSLSSLEGLDLSPVRWLQLRQLRCLASLDGIEAATELATLEVKDLPVLQSLAPLRGLPLSEVSMEGVPCLTDVGTLLGCPLERLEIQGPIAGSARTLLALAGLKEVALIGLGIEWADVDPSMAASVSLFWPLDRRRIHSLSALNRTLPAPVEFPGFAEGEIVLVPREDPRFSYQTEGELEWVTWDGPADVGYMTRRQYTHARPEFVHEGHEYKAVPLPWPSEVAGFWPYSGTTEAVVALVDPPMGTAPPEGD